jgi:hypothetical protein
MLIRAAVLSCAFYLGFMLVVELALIAVARWKGSAGLIFTGWSWAVFSGAIWLGSTSIAFRIVERWIRARLAQ